MLILGISCFFHDAAAGLVEDGILIAAAEEERFSRVKHDFRFPTQAIEFCLRQRGITAAELTQKVLDKVSVETLNAIIDYVNKTYGANAET